MDKGCQIHLVCSHSEITSNTINIQMKTLCAMSRADPLANIVT